MSQLVEIQKELYKEKKAYREELKTGHPYEVSEYFHGVIQGLDFALKTIETFKKEVENGSN